MIPSSLLTLVPEPVTPATPFPKGWSSLAHAVLAQSDLTPDIIIFRDSAGATYTLGSVRDSAIKLARALKGKCADQKYVGVILPPSCTGAITNLALTLLGKVAVNLNYGQNTDFVNFAIEQCGITSVISSAALLTQTKLEPQGTILDIADLVAAAAVDESTEPVTEYQSTALKDEATILFTTGSTGKPKGVILTHENILANAHGIKHQFDLTDAVISGFMPFSHSLGFTGTIWAPLVLGLAVVYHPDPREAKKIGDLVQTHKVSLLVTSPSIMRLWMLRCKPAVFESVTVLLLGSEKLKPELERDIKEKLGKVALQCYGCTETGPLISANSNKTFSTADGGTIDGNRSGSVGRPTPGTSIAIVDINTNAILPKGKDNAGLICAHGRQVMVGYKNRPDATAEVLGNGWYWTGDIGHVDEDGFVFITDRLSRFAKIAGEMVPLVTVEASIREAAATDEMSVHVTTVPDTKRGERIVVFFTKDEIVPADVCKALKDTLPALWVPAASDFAKIDALPVGSTGKIDMQALKTLAKETFGAS